MFAFALALTAALGYAAGRLHERRAWTDRLADTRWWRPRI